jgi:hypothetical protein
VLQLGITRRAGALRRARTAAFGSLYFFFQSHGSLAIYNQNTRELFPPLYESATRSGMKRFSYHLHAVSFGMQIKSDHLVRRVVEIQPL